MDCDGEPPFSTIHCKFTQATVTRSSPTEDERRKMIDALKAEPWEKLRMSLNEICRKIREQSPANLPPKEGSDKAASWVQFLERAKPLCACQTAECARQQFTTFFTGLEDGLCKVRTNTFEREFTRTPGRKKWISNPGPEGICDAVTVIVIEAEESGYLWTYTQTRVTADTTSELCKGFEFNVPVVYSWKALETVFADCKSIKFGS